MSVTIPEIQDPDYEIALGRWVQDARAYLPGIAVPIVQSELRQVILEFFRKAQPWLQELGPFDLAPGQRELKLNPLLDGEFVEDGSIEVPTQQVLYVKQVLFKGQVLSPLMAAGGSAAKEATTPSGYYMPYPDLIRFVPIPTEEHLEAVTVYAVIGPKEPEEHMPQMVGTHFYDIILDGLLGRLFMHPQKPYSNREMGMYRLSQFRGKCSAVRAAAERGFTNTSRVTKFPRFGV